MGNKLPIKSVIIERFRSIPSGQVDLDNPTFLVGQNGSGKSNFVDIFSFLAETMSLPLQAVFDRRAGIAAVRNRMATGGRPPHMGLAVVFGALNGGFRSGRYAFEVKALPNYAFEVVREQCLAVGEDGRRHWFDRLGEKFRSSVTGLDPSLDPASLGLPVVGGDARFAPVLRTLAGLRTYRIEPAKLREMQDPDSGVTLRPDGSNAASVLKEIERHSGDDAQRVCEILATVVPSTTAVHPIKHGNKLTLEFTQEWGKGKRKKRLRFEAFSMSDGTLRAVGLLMAVYQRPTPVLIAIEEPEATIHPGAVGAVLDVLRHASRHMQVVVSTHSPDVLDADWIEGRHLRVVDWQAGATRIAPLADAPRQALREHLMGAGELLRSNALDPEPLFRDATQLRQGGLFEELG